MKPRAEKLMRLVKLSNNMDDRVNQVRDYLSKGICKIEAVRRVVIELILQQQMKIF